MGALEFAQLIISVGMPLAEKLLAKIESNAQVTLQDWDNLKAETKQTAKDVMIVQLNAAGISLDDPKAIALLAGVS